MKSEGAAFRGACARARQANAAKRGDGSVTVLDFGSGDQGRKRVIQLRFNVGVLEAISKRKASTL